MNKRVSISRLFEFPGYVVEGIRATARAALIEIRYDRRCSFYCPVCGRAMGVNRRVFQTARDLPLGQAASVTLTYEAIQCYCSSCSRYHTFIPEGIDMNAKATNRLMHYVCKLCRFMPVDKVTEFVPISTSTARRWDKRVLSTSLAKPNLDNIRVLLIDEKSIGKHHHYITVVMNGDSGEVLHIAEGKKKKSLSKFFDKLTPEQIESIKAVGIDRGGAYQTVVKKRCPKAAIVYDKFHLIANYNTAIDDVRRSEWRKANEENKSVIKGQRYNLFKNPENLKPKQKVSLEALLKTNENLSKAYILKDALKVLWMYKYPKSAGKYMDKWISWAEDTGLDILKAFAKSLKRARAGILNFCRYSITTAKLESFNNTIERIVRRACGYRDLEYLFLKIRQESL